MVLFLFKYSSVARKKVLIASIKYTMIEKPYISTITTKSSIQNTSTRKFNFNNFKLILAKQTRVIIINIYIHSELFKCAYRQTMLIVLEIQSFIYLTFETRNKLKKNSSISNRFKKLDYYYYYIKIIIKMVSFITFC